MYMNCLLPDTDIENTGLLTPDMTLTDTE